MELFTLTDIIKNSADLYPNHQAFKCGDISVSYKELDIKTSQLAKCLIDSGIKKGARVGIYLNRCLETAIAIYGILKAGAAYVPLDFTAPHQRTRFLINNCGIEILISSNKQKRKITALLDNNVPVKAVIGLSQDSTIKTLPWEIVFNTSLENYQAVKIIEDDLAYVMFTSGSTGAPKGIMHTHRSGLNYAKLSADLYRVTPTDRVANHAPINFDISTFGYFTAPLAGASTIIITDAHTKFPVSLVDLMAKENLTIWYSVPLALVQMLLSGALDKVDLKSLRWVLFGGEVFGLKHLKELMEKWPHATFSNVYGPAEVNQCTYYHFNSLSEINSHLPIGKVWDNTEFKILDDNDNEVPEGKQGLLTIRSGTMMKGYWNNKALTEASLYTETVAPNLNHVYYRTGDLVKLNKNGELLFLGRKDNQIKLRGFRIEIDEIENTLLNYDGVVEAAVILQNTKEEKKLIATLLADKTANITPEDLKKHCKNNLPVYAVPSRILILGAFPRTSSGKVNKKEIERKIKTP